MKKFPEGCKILQICLAPAADEVAPGPFGGRGGLYEALRPPIWPLASTRAKKPLHFAVFMAMTSITYMLLEFFSFERIKKCLK